MDRLGGLHFKGYSAGFNPADTVNTHALELLEQKGMDTRKTASKS